MIREYTSDQILDMLQKIGVPQDYHDWKNFVIDALILGLDPERLEYEWSSQGAKYTPGEIINHWKTIKQEGGRNGGGLIQAAIAAGWDPRGAGTAPKAPPSPQRKSTETQPKAERTPTILPPMGEKYREAERSLYRGQDHAAQRRDYLKALFAPDEYVNIAWSGFRGEDGKIHPAGDLSAMKVKDILEGSLHVLNFEGYDHVSGAWIKINPVCESPKGRDGKGKAVADTDITAFRYVLIESDNMTEAAQLAAYARLRLPVAAVVLSGGKSVHAIVKIQARNREEYDQRVRKLYDFCKSYGLTLDEGNKNPARFTRLPGVTRGEREQILLDVGGGCSCWDEFEDFMLDTLDGLPPVDDLEDVIDENLQPLDPEIIAGTLRCGHIMVLTGGSKASKSFLLIELALAVASGGAWLGRQCKQGRVLYVNMEINRISVQHRFQKIKDAAKIETRDIAGQLEEWTLRGTGATLPQIVKSIERKAKWRKYDMIILDPVYKLLGDLDENASGDVGQLFTMFDRIATVTGAAVVVCHHHAKGGQAARSPIDRGSGSGTFARSPDALVDMIELETTPDALINAGLPLGPVEPVGLSYSWTHRDFPPEPDTTGFFVYPLHVPDVHNALRGARSLKDAMAADAKRKNANKAVHWYDIVTSCYEDMAAADKSGNGIVPADAFVEAVMHRAGTDSRTTAEKKIRESGYSFKRAVPSKGLPKRIGPSETEYDD